MSVLLLNEGHVCARCGALAIKLEQLYPGYHVCWKCAEAEAQWENNRRPARECDHSE